MKTLSKTQDVVELVDSSNYYFKGNKFNDYSEMRSAAEEHFMNVTEGSDNQEEYYNYFGLDLGEVHINTVKIEKYFVEEVNTTVIVTLYEAYIDSGVSNEDYFHAYTIFY
jgi:hypothetical protein